MTLPALITVKATIRDASGPVSGRLTWHRDTSLLPAAADDPSYLIPEVVETVVGSDGVLAQAIYSTDDPASSPTGWTWTVYPHFPHWRKPFSVAVPYNAAGGEIDLNDLVPVPPDGDGVLYAAANHTHPGGGSVNYGSVTAEPTAGSASANGVADTVSRSDHKHGNPALPTPAEIGASAIGHTHDGGGGGGSSIRVDLKTVTSGSLTPQASVGWAKLTSSPALSVAAAAGDYVEMQVLSLLHVPQSGTFLDFAVEASAVLVRFASNGTATPAPEGLSGLYRELTGFIRAGVGFGFVVQAGDLQAGTVNIVWAVKGAGGGTIYASADYPLVWRLINHGAPA